MTRVFLLSGPACVGKGPLVKEIKRRFGMKLIEVPVIKSFESREGILRPTDVPAHFFPAATIMSWQGDPRYLVGDCRGYPQAIDIKMVRDAAQNTDDKTILIEAYHTIGRQLQESLSYVIPNLTALSVFLSPLSQQEINDLRATGVDFPQYLETLMLHKQLVRARSFGRFSGGIEQRDFLPRAKGAYDELCSAWKFYGVLVSYDAEGRPNWEDPIQGDASRLVRSFGSLLQGKDAVDLEHWEPGLLAKA